MLCRNFVILIFIQALFEEFKRTEGTVGITYPYIDGAVLGRGINGRNYEVKDQLLKNNFNQKIVPITNTQTKFGLVQSEADATNILDVSGQVGVGLTGQFSFSVSGAAQYVENSARANNEIEMLFSINNLDYFVEVTDIENQGTYNCAAKAKAEGVDYVVGGMLYGAQCTASAKWKYNNESEKQKIMGSLDASFDAAGQFGVSAGGKVENEHLASLASSSYTLSVTCNIELQTLPSNFEELAQFAKSLPLSYYNLTDLDRGRALSLYLVPIDQIKYCQGESALEVEGQGDSTNQNINLLFTYLNKKLEDVLNAHITLENCRSAYQFQDVRLPSVQEMETAFYIAGRAITRKRMVLRTLLAEQEQNASAVEKPNDFLNFYNNIGKVYINYYVYEDNTALEILRRTASRVQVVPEGSPEETEPGTPPIIPGTKVWTSRMNLLCYQRQLLSNSIRPEF